MYAFIKEYNAENPTSPIKIVTVGRGFNKLENICDEYSAKHFNTPRKNLYVPKQYHFEDALEGQIVLYNPADEKPLNKGDSNEQQSTNAY